MFSIWRAAAVDPLFCNLATILINNSNVKQLTLLVIGSMNLKPVHVQTCINWAPRHTPLCMHMESTAALFWFPIPRIIACLLPVLYRPVIIFGIRPESNMGKLLHTLNQWSKKTSQTARNQDSKKHVPNLKHKELEHITDVRPIMRNNWQPGQIRKLILGERELVLCAA